MSTSLWPALLAAIVGGGGGGGRPAVEEGGMGSSMGPIQSLLALSVLGEHALYWWIGLLCFIGLAYATNPSEASFKTHLTDLSFHLHLRRLRAHETDHLNNSNNNTPQTLPGDFKRPDSPSAASSAASVFAPTKDGSSSSNTGGKITNTSGKTSKAGSNQGSLGHQATAQQTTAHSRTQGQASSKPGRISHANGESGRPHVLSFSNRVSISLKTPAYVRTSYGLWSTVRILPAPKPKNSSIGSGHKASGLSSGTPGRPLLNGVPAVTRRASTTLQSLNDRTSKKSSSSSASGSSSSSSKSSSRKGGLVSTVAHGISASLTAPVCTPWLEQGGYFIGFLGYWWTIDDGTSFSGARERTRLGNAILAVEEQDEEDDVSVDQHGPDHARHADDLEGGHAFYENGHAQTISSRPDDQAANATTVNVASTKRKHPSKASQGASFRGGQRRSSPTPRQITNKKRGSGSGASGTGNNNNASQTGSSGDVTPVTPTSAIPLDRSRLESSSQHLQTNDDSHLPGLPFHVDRTKDNNSAQHVPSESDVHVDAQALKTYAKEGEVGISAISHSASAPDAAVATVSPALALLQSQLDDLRATSAATQAKLEAVVEELQSRRRDEDAVRTELKARTKLLEESKREAETERLDAEKRLTAARSLKKTVEDRVSKARSELTKLEKKEKELQEKMLKSREERRVKLDELRDKVKHREALLIKEVESTEKLDKRVALLEKEIEDRKQDLFQFRREEANAAAIAVTNRMNRAGRGLPGGNASNASATGNAPATATNTTSGGAAHGNHVHAHGPQSGASITAKKHMQPVHGGHAHRHPSQHPNAAVPIAYPYTYSEDQAKPANARSPSPGGMPTTASTTSGTQISSVAPSVEARQGQNYGSTFLDHRMQSRRSASAAGVLSVPQAVTGIPSALSSSMNTSVIGNSASAASALYSRQLDSNDDDRLEGGYSMGETAEGEGRSLLPGSTFAPFGPASPTSPSTIGASSPREQHSLLKESSPSLTHVPYFASDKASQAQQHHRLRMTTSREDILAAMRSQASVEDVEYVSAADVDATPVMALRQDLAVADEEDDSYVLSQARPMGKKSGTTSGLRRESFDSEASFTSSNGGPLSPMTPHQASLIPSQLFDMLDEVEMPASPTPFQMAGGVAEPHETFTRGISDAFDHASSSDNHENQQQVPKRTSGMYSPWADLDMDAGFDFDKPLGAGYHASSAGVSRKASGRDTLGTHQRTDLLRRRSGSEVHTASSVDLVSNGNYSNSGTTQGDAIFAGYGQIHGQSGGLRSNTSSSGGSNSPHLTSSASINFPAAFGKMSPNDLLFDKARHALSLNPDAKAFSFNRPLPSSGSAGSLNSIGGGGGGRSSQLPSNAVGAIGDARHAFDSAAAPGSHSINGNGSESPILSNGTLSTGNATWSSPNLTSRGLHNLGYGNATASSASSSTVSGATNANFRESVRSASGPPLTNPSSAGNASPGHGHSFSPFDDDDLLKGW